MSEVKNLEIGNKVITLKTHRGNRVGQIIGIRESELGLGTRYLVKFGAYEEESYFLSELKKVSDKCECR